MMPAHAEKAVKNNAMSSVLEKQEERYQYYVQLQTWIFATACYGDDD